jgi:tetratricopeptide (TPR) repeat protein
VRRFRPLAPLLALLALSACASNAWRVAREADTGASYRAFLRDHPGHENAEAARVHLAEKEFEAASAQHSVLSYKRFLEEFPDSGQAHAARALLEGLRFNAAQADGTAQALRQFLRDHPDGAHREAADRLLVEAEFKEGGEAGADERARLVRQRPEDPRRAALQTQLDDEAFAAARSADRAFGYYDYLRHFPAGAHREAVQARLFAHRVMGLLVSGSLQDARREVERSPLSASVEGLDALLRAAEAKARVAAARDPAVRTALAGHYLRSLEDLQRALGAPDPLDRWQAAEELGQHVSVAALEPLMNALRTARNPLIRQRAFESLRRVLAALPPEVSAYELATRIEALRPTAESPETWLTLAVLLDLAGRLDQAALEYQRAWEKGVPDPVVLHRWIEIRRERGQPFSAAVAARQLALWAEGVAQNLEAPTSGDARVAVSDVRQLCAAAQGARHALRVLQGVKPQTVDFPDDVLRFELQAKDAVRLAEARLGDFELRLRAQDRNARTCDDGRVAERVAEGERLRAEALRRLAKRPRGDPGRMAVELARAQDPSPGIRALAAGLGD